MVMAIETPRSREKETIMSYLVVSNEDPVRLDGYIDSAGALQISHDTDNLVNYDQEIWCSHDTNTSITIKIYDFVVGETTWVMSARHDETSWSRASDHVYATFDEEPSTPYEVDITATAGTAKQRVIKIKPQPQLPGQ
jgi:hypothetical protein